MDDRGLVTALQQGDEAAFVELVRRYQSSLLRLAEATVGSRAVAEEVTQDTWIAVLRGIDRFEGRSSLKTWLYRVLLNRARSAAGRETRAGRPSGADDERFDAAGAWAEPPVPWSDAVDDRVTAEHLAARACALLEQLPPSQREVVLLRDVDGLSPSEVSELLAISDGNQRVLLHRGRSRLRALLAVEMGSVR
jgi:RNA polymerase sigma-70 factor (ECF subfamily)